MARSPRLPPPESFEIFVCRSCGAWDLAPEEIGHSGYCSGRTDPAHIDYVVAEAVHVAGYIRDHLESSVVPP